MSDQEFKRQRRVTDMSLSAHCDYSEILRRRQRALTLGILVLSVVATSLAFVGAEVHADLGFAAAELPTWAGLVSTLVFVLALVDLLSSWSETAARHEEAAGRLSTLKALQETALADGSTAPGELSGEYWRTMRAVEPIPDRWFVKLKARHLRKKEMSKALDRAPGVPGWFLRLWVAWQGIKQLTGEGSSKTRHGNEFKIDERDNLNGEEPTP